MTKPRFALIGAAGYIAPKHMAAIANVGGDLVAAVDPHDSVGILDRHFPDARFFTEVERFDRYLEKLRRQDAAGPVDYVSICTPNYLHDAHVRLALRVKADAICEKPLVLNPWNLNQLSELEQEHGRRVHTIVQLRHHPAVLRLRERLESERVGAGHDVVLTYVTRRGRWYRSSWKGDPAKAGGVGMNIGIHFFDLLGWLFGKPLANRVHLSTETRMSGYLELGSARIRWFLSIDAADLPVEVRERGGYAHRSLQIDGQELDLSDGFGDLHEESYRRILAGEGFGIEDARQSIELLYGIRHGELSSAGNEAHPYLAGNRDVVRSR